MDQIIAASPEPPADPAGPPVQPTAAILPAVPRKRGRPRDPEADVRILAAAAELILARGYDAMTVDEVAAHAKVGKATVYRRWARKEDLAVAAMSQLYDAELSIPDTGSIYADLLSAYDRVLTFVNSPMGEAFLRTTIAESVRDTRIATLYRSASERVEATAAEAFTRAIDRGELRADMDVTWATQWLTGLLALCVISGRALPLVGDADMLVRMLLDGVTVR